MSTCLDLWKLSILSISSNPSVLSKIYIVSNLFQPSNLSNLSHPSSLFSLSYPSNLSNLSYPSNPSNLSNLSNPSNPSNLPGSAATTLLQIPSTKLYAACVPGRTLRTVWYVVFVARWLQRLDIDTNRPDTNWQCCNHRATKTACKTVRGVRPRMHSAYSFLRGICSTVVAKTSYRYQQTGYQLAMLQPPCYEYQVQNCTRRASPDALCVQFCTWYL